MARNQNPVVGQTIKIDSQKFISVLNNSIQAKVALFEERVRRMGRQAGKNWRLAALNSKDLYIEDLDTHQYMVADHSRVDGKVTITNIRPVRIVEEDKNKSFFESCLRLVGAIEENDQSGMAAAFARMKAHMFSGRAIPHCGTIRCRDGILRHINVIRESSSLDWNARNQIVAAIVEALRDKVIVENGIAVAGYFGDEKVKLPVTKWAARKLVARRMRDAAQNAYWSEGFQTRIYNLARLISEGKIEEAVRFISPFLDEMEEFTLLTRQQTQTLIENALAARAVFNQQLCDDTATLFYRTNLRVNRHKIIDEWRNIAKVAEHPVLAENVQILESAKNFEAAYDKFIRLIFETISNREIAAEALATTLQTLRDKTPKLRESHDLSMKLNRLIHRLRQRDVDDAAIYEAEDLIATIQEELTAAEALSDFDQIPDDATMGNPPTRADMPDATTPPEPDEAKTTPSAGNSAPIININSPLIQIGGTSGVAPAADATGGTETGPVPGQPDETMAGAGVQPGRETSDDDELEALLSGDETSETLAGQAPPTPTSATQMDRMRIGGARAGAQGGALGGGRAQVFNQSLHRSNKAILEGGMPTNDPYAIREHESIPAEKLRITDYGAPVITDAEDLDRIARIMMRLMQEHNLTGRALQRNLENMARASIRAIGLRIPESRMATAVEQAISAFIDKHPERWLIDAAHDRRSITADDEGVAEDQYKYPWRKPRGLNRASYGREAYPYSSRSRHGTKSESDSRRRSQDAIAENISWGESQDDAIAGEFCGVRFIFDHGGASSELKPVILSEDGAIEIPVPEHLYDSAFAAAGLAKGDGTDFVRWLAGSIEQLRPITEEEDRAIEEAVAKITAGSDGTISVEVTPDVNVDEISDDETGGDEGGDDEDDDDSAVNMAPVDSIDTSNTQTTTADADSDDKMPDFEADNKMDKDETDEQKADEQEMGENGDPSLTPYDSSTQTTDGSLTDEPSDDDESMSDRSDSRGRPGSSAASADGSSDDSSEDEDDKVQYEDRDITAPPSPKYTAHVKDNKRKMPEVEIPDEADDELDSIGPEYEVDDGTGTEPPIARKGE